MRQTSCGRAANKITLISASDVEKVFTDTAIADLAELLKLERNADLAGFGCSVRSSASAFLNSKARSTASGLQKACTRLYRATLQAQPGAQAHVEHLVQLVREMPLGVRQWLIRCNPRIRVIPQPEEIRFPQTREEALNRLRLILYHGVVLIEDPSGSWAVKPILKVPPIIEKGRPRGLAEREFVCWLAMDYCKFKGRLPPKTVHFEHTIRGPFAKFVDACFELVGAPTGNITKLINEYGATRRLLSGE